MCQRKLLDACCSGDNILSNRLSKQRRHDGTCSTYLAFKDNSGLECSHCLLVEIKVQVAGLTNVVMLRDQAVLGSTKIDHLLGIHQLF